eukprot:751319-Hanusia_phi.AAC.1
MRGNRAWLLLLPRRAGCAGGAGQGVARERSAPAGALLRAGRALQRHANQSEEQAEAEAVEDGAENEGPASPTEQEGQEEDEGEERGDEEEEKQVEKVQEEEEEAVDEQELEGLVQAYMDK